MGAWVRAGCGACSHGKGQVASGTGSGPGPEEEASEVERQQPETEEDNKGSQVGKTKAQKSICRRSAVSRSSTMSYRVDTEREVGRAAAYSRARDEGHWGPRVQRPWMLGPSGRGLLLQMTGPSKATLATEVGQAWVCGLRASPARPERRGGTGLLSIRARRPIRRRPRPTRSPERARRGPAAAGVRRPGLAPFAGQPAQITGFGLRALGALSALTSLSGCCAGGAPGVGVRKRLRLGLCWTVGWAAACATDGPAHGCRA